MAFDFKSASPTGTISTSGFVLGADSQSDATPKIYNLSAFLSALLGSTAFTGATVTTSQPLLNLTQTWNAGGVTFTGLRFNATDTASASASLLLDLQVGGSSKFAVNKAGRIFSELIGNDSAFGATNAAIFFTGANEVHYVSSGEVLRLTSTALQIASTINLNWNSDLILGRNAAASLRLGAADAAAPVAQTLGVQSVVAGTTNTAGTNFTIKGSAGTGTGAGGSIIFQVAPAGSSGTAQNAFSTALTINSSGQLLVGDGSNTAPTFAFSGATNRGFYRSGTLLVFADSNADIWWSAASNIVMRNNGSFAFSSGTVAGSGIDVILARDAANTLALRNGTSAQVFNVYETYTDASNYSRLAFITGAAFEIQAQAAGTGTARSVQIKGGSGAGFFFGGNAAVQWQVNSSGHLLAQADNTYDIGASGATRPRNIYTGGFAILGSYIQPSYVRLAVGGNEVRIYQTGNGVMTLYNAAETDFNRIQLGGTTSSFPALKRSSATLQVRLADDTAFAPISAQVFQSGTTTVASLPTASSYTGALAYVNDATATTARSTVAGGGANKVIVFSDGTNWLIVA